MVMTNVYKPEKIKHINIDTQFHDEYHSTTSSDLMANFNISLPERINDVKSLCVTNIEIPVEQNSVAPGEDFDEYNNDFLKTGIDKAQEPI